MAAPSMPCSIVEVLAILRGIHEALLRNAAPDDAGATVSVFFGDRDPFAQRSSNPACPNACRR
jgi:hypothetical protein